MIRFILITMLIFFIQFAFIRNSTAKLEQKQIDLEIRSAKIFFWVYYKEGWKYTETHEWYGGNDIDLIIDIMNNSNVDLKNIKIKIFSEYGLNTNTQEPKKIYWSKSKIIKEKKIKVIKANEFNLIKIEKIGKYIDTDTELLKDKWNGKIKFLCEVSSIYSEKNVKNNFKEYEIKFIGD